MKRLTIISAISACLISCDVTTPDTTQTTAFSFSNAEVISMEEKDGRHALALRFSDTEGNILDLTALTVSDYLDGGTYRISAQPQECYQASAMMQTEGETMPVASGSLTISRHNEEYLIRMRLESNGALSYTGGYNGTIPFNAMDIPPASGQEKGEEIRDLILTSETLGMDIPYSIYLPEDYSESKEYPVLYVLHGMYGDNNDWFRSGKISMNASEAEEKYRVGMIVVSPYAMNSFYCDELDEDTPYMTFFFEEFIPYIESTYSIRQGRSSRAIAGISMGGYGAIYYGLLHPEMFCHVYACSPATYAGNSVPVLGDMLDSQDSGNTPCITIEMGTSDPLILISGSFVRKMREKGVAYEYITRSGSHEWPFWKACTPKVIRKAVGYFI